MNVSAEVWTTTSSTRSVFDGVGRLGRRNFSAISSLFDGFVIDKGLVDGPGRILSRIGDGLRRVQSGLAAELSVLDGHRPRVHVCVDCLQL